MGSEATWLTWEERARGAAISFRHHDGHELHCPPGTDPVTFSAQCGALIERIDRHDEKVNRLHKSLEDTRRDRNHYRDRVHQAEQQQRIDGDMLSDVITCAFPGWLAEYTARRTAEQAVAELARNGGVTVLRGTLSEPWQPDTCTMAAAPVPDTADGGSVVDATIHGDGWTEYAVLVGSDDHPIVVADGYDDAEAASELGQHVPNAWLGHRQVVTDRWSRVT